MVPLLKNIQYLGGGDCESPGYLSPESITGYMDHPSGARGEFTLTSTSHGRSGVDRQCSQDIQTQVSTPYYPKIFDTFALTKKVLSGPGLVPMEWQTTYSAQASSWSPCNGCVATKQVEVTEPNGARTVYKFGTLFRQTEGELQETDFFEQSGAWPRTNYVTYAEPLAGPVGVSDQRRGDGELG